jgi:hypothetical protein
MVVDSGSGGGSCECKGSSHGSPRAPDLSTETAVKVSRASSAQGQNDGIPRGRLHLMESEKGRERGGRGSPEAGRPRGLGMGKLARRKRSTTVSDGEASSDAGTR